MRLRVIDERSGNHQGITHLHRKPERKLPKRLSVQRQSERGGEANQKIFDATLATPGWRLRGAVLGRRLPQATIDQNLLKPRESTIWQRQDWITSDRFETDSIAKIKQRMVIFHYQHHGHPAQMDGDKIWIVSGDIWV